RVGSAAAGFRIWCFVLGALLRVVVTAVGVQLRHPWRPSLQFRFGEARAYFRFGLSTSTSQILYYLYTNADYPVVSKLFGAAALGLYRASYEIVLELVKVIATVFVDVSFPTFARLRGDRAELTQQFISFTRQSLVAIIPFVLVIFIAADSALSVAWGPSYAVAATAARILCVIGLLRAVSQIVPPLLDGVGHPGRTVVCHLARPPRPVRDLRRRPRPLARLRVGGAGLGRRLSDRVRRPRLARAPPPRAPGGHVPPPHRRHPRLRRGRRAARLRRARAHRR